jgi:hypothetical protein
MTLADLTPLEQTLIGAGVAIVAGMLGAIAGAWWQGRQAGRIARAIRAAEREEGALLAIGPYLEAALARVTWMLDNPAGAELPDPYELVRQGLEEIELKWRVELARQVSDRQLRGLLAGVFVERHRLEDECLKRHTTAIGLALERCDDFADYATRLVDAIKTARAAIDERLAS